MNRQLAILNVLDTSPRPVPADVIAALVHRFDAEPPFSKNVAKAVQQVKDECDFMEKTGDVFYQAHRDQGRLWSITKIGRARIS